jgi:molybdopterin synthase sulfur carrier subunit
MSITVLYFASLREAAGKSSEQLALPDSLSALYEGLNSRYRFGFEQHALRVAVNDRFTAWQTPVHEGDTVAFIPPVSGG